MRAETQPGAGRGLYAITPDLAHTPTLLAKVEAALAGGVRWLQYRNKIASADLRREQAQALSALGRTFSARLIINDDVALAQAVGAAGAHLGGDDGDLAAARATLGPDAVLGASCYADLERARRAHAAGASYLAFGAVYPSPTKPHAARAPLELIAAARAESGLPVAAIGGITIANAPEVIAAGADLLAVITDLFDAPDIAARARAYQALFESSTERGTAR